MQSATGTAHRLLSGRKVDERPKGRVTRSRNKLQRATRKAKTTYNASVSLRPFKYKQLRPEEYLNELEVLEKMYGMITLYSPELEIEFNPNWDIEHCMIYLNDQFNAHTGKNWLLHCDDNYMMLKCATKYKFNEEKNYAFAIAPARDIKDKKIQNLFLKVFALMSKKLGVGYIDSYAYDGTLEHHDELWLNEELGEDKMNYMKENYTNKNTLFQRALRAEPISTMHSLRGIKDQKIREWAKRGLELVKRGKTLFDTFHPIDSQWYCNPLEQIGMFFMRDWVLDNVIEWENAHWQESYGEFIEYGDFIIQNNHGGANPEITSITHDQVNDIIEYIIETKKILDYAVRR